MKSIVFTHAFKVYRHEMEFTEGLFKAVEMGALEDFIAILNTLTGETKYNLEQINQLLANLRSSPKESHINIQELIQEIEKLKKEQMNIRASIQTYEHQILALTPAITPGVNSFLLSLVGVMFTIIFFVVQLKIASLLCLLATVCGSVILYIWDKKTLKKQMQIIEHKKNLLLNSINKLREQSQSLVEMIQKKKAELDLITPKGFSQKTESKADSGSTLIPIIED